MPARLRRRSARGLLVALVVLAAALPLPAAATGHEAPPPSASGFLYVKTLDQALCQPAYTGGFAATYYTRGDCLRVDFQVSGTSEDSAVQVQLIGPDGDEAFRTLGASRLSSGTWRLVTRSDATWPAGRITLRVIANGTPAGDGALFLNALSADVSVIPKEGGAAYRPGEPVPLSGSVVQLNDMTGTTHRNGVPAAFSLRVRTPSGEVRGPYGPFTAMSDGRLPAGVTLPAEATEGVTADASTGFRLVLGVDVVDATYEDLRTGTWHSDVAGSGQVPLVVRPDVLLLENAYVSSLGWVKPGETYPFRLFVRNHTDQPHHDVVVTVPAPSGTSFVAARPLAGAGTAGVAADEVTWLVPSVPADSAAVLVVQARAATAGQDPRIVWKDLSTTASMTYAGGPTLTAVSHGPKVIPPSGGFETARYGDKPFPMIPVDFRDRKHKPHHSGEALSWVVNGKDHPGSTYNLYQEMSYGQLHPIGEVPSSSIASADFAYEPGFAFTERDPRKPTCRGATLGGLPATWGTPVYPERVSDGWYQLPGDTEYYGGDFPAFTATTIGIDAACGDTSKMIYDAVQVADPEIDYNQFDSDKDGVVDFTMVVFAGCGGNGASQLGPLICEDGVPYDNPWPHSSSLESSYTDPATGLSGYISDDQLTDLEGVPQCWQDATYSDFTDCAADGGSGRDDLPVHVRVGPYNINPEDAIDKASVIAHEYGHHLGLPDFYSGYSAYNDLNLMAADYSQHMTIFSKQELGWVVPRVLQPGESVEVTDWEEVKNDTGEIQWSTPSGEPYTLSAANGDQNIHNGEAYAAKLPRRLVIDPDKVEEQASAPYVWWSGRGNDFGCAPKAGHNLDVALPELADVPEGTPITVRFKSSFDIEWDFDYGFVLATTDGSTYQSQPSENGYTTSRNLNPNGISCLSTLDNGITGTSGAYEQGAAQVAVDRAGSSYASGSPFVQDEYDLSEYAGQDDVVLRFSYATDAGLDRPGWFVDDLEVLAGDEVIHSSSFTEDDELRLFPGGCGPNGMRVTAKCTAGWSKIKADEPSALDHAYYLELRDRSGFDFDGRGQSDRGAIGWEPGVFVEYTDEARGYGNNGANPPPRQHYLDSQPQPGYDCGDNLEETRPEPAVLTDPRCQDAAFTSRPGDSHFDDDNWVDNFWDDSVEDRLWRFAYGCLSLDVLTMSGDTGNTETLPSDLSADAVITAGAGCTAFDHWRDVQNAAPTAFASVSSKGTGTGVPLTFDASGTFDDLTPTDELDYSWLFGDGTTASGEEVQHAYAQRGTYTATLTVTDAEGASSTDTVQVAVRGPDLRVTDVSSTDGPGGKLEVRAVVHNDGPGVAPASRTGFAVDGSSLGVIDTPALAPGRSALVTVQWNPRGTRGEQTVVVTADQGAAVDEESEDNNTAEHTVVLRRSRSG